MELLPHDLIEEILQRLSPKSLLRFKSVSKQWKSTIESPFFQHNHLIHHRQKSKSNPHLLMINTSFKPSESTITLELKSSISRNILIPWENNNLFNFCHNSIDGLVCFYDGYDPVVIFNPTTRWYRTLPPSIYQQRRNRRMIPFSNLGFGKDEINGLYKPVWLYNNSWELNSANATTCEVFDFKTNAWRFIEPSFPKRIKLWQDPVYLNGLMYWLIEEGEIWSVLSLNLHTETFEIVCEIPISKMVIFNLDDNLCGHDLFDGGHVIWSWNLEEKTWNKIYVIDLQRICPLYKHCKICDVRPFALVKEEKKNLILCDYDCCMEKRNRQVVLYDSHTTRYRSVVSMRQCNITLCYFPSLISIL